MSESREISRKDISFNSFHEEVVSGIEAAVAKHLPTTKVVFLHCGGCDGLHGHVVIEKDEVAEIHLDFAISPDGWREIVRN